MIEAHNSIAEKFLKKGSWLFLFAVLIGPLGYIIKMIISSELSVEEVGILYGIMSLITLLAAYNDFGITESLKYFIPKFVEEKRYDKVKSILLIGFFIQIVTSLLLMWIFFFGAEYISQNYFSSDSAKVPLQIFSFFFLGINLFQIINTFFLSIQNTFLHKITDFIRMLFVLGGVLMVFYYDSKNIILYSYCWVLGLYIATALSGIIFYSTYYKKYLQGKKFILEKEFLKKIWLYAVLVFVGSQASNVLSQMDMQMVIYMLGAEQAGYYTNYLSLIGIFFIFIGPFFLFLFPVFSELAAKNDIGKIKTIKQTISDIFINFGIAGSTFFYIFSGAITFLFFGEKFLPSSYILQASIGFLLFNFLLQINFSIMAATGKVKERVNIVLVAIVFNFIANIFLINMIGSSGSAIATGLGWMLIYFLSEEKLPHFKCKYNWKQILPNLGTFGLVSIFVYSFYTFDVGIGRINTLFLLLAFFTLWFILFYITNKQKFFILYSEIKKLKYD